MDGIEEVWVTLRGHDPVPGLVLRWTERLGLRWADVTYELDGRVRTELLPLMALRPKTRTDADGADSTTSDCGDVRVARRHRLESN